MFLAIGSNLEKMENLLSYLEAAYGEGGEANRKKIVHWQEESPKRNLELNL